jgi:hypothetical protein
MSTQKMQELLAGTLGGATSEKALERELVLGFELEHRRKAEDEMKKRAIHTAGTYDEFKNLVAAATQKPLEAKDYGGKAVMSMNKALGGGVAAVGAGLGGGALGLGGASLGLGLSFPSGEGLGASCGGASGGSSHAGGVAASPAVGAIPTPAGFGLPPNSPGEFERTWRRLEAARRPSYLAWLGPSRLGHAFRKDIEGGMLGAIVSALGAVQPGGAQLCDEWGGQSGPEAVNLRLDIAAALLQSAPPSALGLAVDTLSSQEKAAAALLLRTAVEQQHKELQIIKQLGS